MSLDKAINSGKEYRKNYFGSKRFDRSCRNHGNCGYCENNRTFKNKKREISCEQQENAVDSCDHDELPSDGTQKEN